MVHRLFERQARRTPDSIAVESENVRWTFAELDELSGRIARRLRARGVAAESLVGIYLDRGAWLIAAMIGVLKAGGAYVPIDPVDPEPRLRLLLADAKPSLVITEQRLRGRFAPGVELMFIDGGGDQERESESRPEDPSSLAYVMYTSGSTGTPKGVCITHRGIVRLVRDVRYVKLDAEEVLLHAAPPTFDASTFEVWGALLNGARLVVIPAGRSLVEQIGEAVQRRGVTTLWLTAALFRQMVDRNLAGLRGVRQLLTGGDVVSAAHVRRVLEQYPSLTVINGYGPTECTTFACAYACSAESAIGASVPIGWPIEETTVHLLDDRLVPVADGVAGEIFIGGQGVARGYLNRAQATREAFLRDPFAREPDARMYRTGDRALRRPDGALEFLGRADRQVKLRGVRVELDEIESALRGHPSVEDAAVTAVSNAAGDKDVIAHVVFRQDSGGDDPTGARDGLRRWRDVYDRVIYAGIAHDSAVGDATLNTIGWKSSYSGDDISHEEMREQVDQTVARIRSLAPARVLEIGCGTGMLLFRLAPHCRRYVGMDFSEAALAYVERKLDRTASSGQVTLLHREADDPPVGERFDAVVLNSIVQHFPSVDYLRRVMTRAIDLVDEGGFVFVGDVRSLALLRMCHLSVEMSRADPELRVEELEALVEQKLQEEGELILDPAFFTTAGFSRVRGARVQLKRGRHHNELTRFRYDVWLEIGGGAPPAVEDPATLTVRSRADLERLAKTLRERSMSALRVSGVANGRVAAERAALRVLADAARPQTVGALRARLAADDELSVDPEELWNLAEACGYNVEIDWTRGRADGALELTLARAPARPALRPACFDEGWRRHAHDPLGPFKQRARAARLRQDLTEQYPAYLVPAFLIPLARLPLTANGKVDSGKLPLPEPLRRRRVRQLVRPGTNVEAELCELWQEVLGVGAVGLEESFFDLGGESLKAIVLVDRIRERFGVDLSTVSVFEHPTLGAMARRVTAQKDALVASAPVAPVAAVPRERRSQIAIIGMAVRVPGAASLDGFWSNLCAGVESISSFTKEELREAGVDGALLDDPAYVKSAPVLADSDKFDAAFFGYTPREARFIDPQQRVLLECAWEAMEHAGYDPHGGPRNVGTFVGSSLNSYLLYSGLLPQFEKEFVLTLSSNDKDFLATRINYKLDLRGPALTIQTACSTSLAAVHVACQHLRLGECDMALAGGVSVKVPQKRGYLWRRGGLLASDGHVRPFDANASGTVFGSGAGIVLLKPLADALRDNDSIYGVIIGSAVNNDGADKASYTAPSIRRQADVVSQAIANAGVEPDTISVLEAHGTGTPIGDPIEVEALTRAFRSGTPKQQFCAIGSVKANVGHLEAAAGVISLIKTTLSLHHRTIPRSLNYDAPNPQIAFAESPFFVNAATTPWSAGSWPRRAGVNALGVGGTNVHVIVEEAPDRRPRSVGTLPYHLLPISARNGGTLDLAKQRLAAHLEANPGVDLGDVAFTLQTGRKRLGVREVLVCSDRADALEQLSRAQPRVEAKGRRALLFLCSRHVSGTWDAEALLYETEPVFRARVDQSCGWLRRRHGLATDRVLWTDTEITAFIAQHAELELWASWGIHPEGVVGAGVGELVAACAAGVLTSERALSILTNEFTAEPSNVPPRIRLFSTATGSWLRAEDLPDDAGWAARVRGEPPAAATASCADLPILLELGGGAACSPILGGVEHLVSRPQAIAPARGMLTALGRLWAGGIEIDWNGLHAGHERRRVALPTYPFERQRHWWENG